MSWERTHGVVRSHFSFIRNNYVNVCKIKNIIVTLHKNTHIINLNPKIMKKTLRYSLLLLLAMISGTMFAENIIWEEDWTTWDGQVKTVLDQVNPNYTFVGTVTNTDGTFKSGTTIYNEKLAGGEAPELLIAKNGGAFTAKIPMNGASGSMTLSFKCNKALTVTAENATLGESTAAGNDYVYPVNVAPGTQEISITFTMATNANARFDNAKLFQGEGKKPAGLSWGTSARTVTLGANDNVFPILENANNLPIVYTSSETTIATIDNAGTIELLSAGTTVITAAFEGNDEYEAADVSYTLTVKDAVAPPTDITVSEALNIINGLEDGKTTEEVYHISGYIVGTPDFQRKDDGSLYGNVNFEIAGGPHGTPTITVFRCKNFGNENFTEETIGILKDEDQVIIEGKLQKYVKDGNMTPEITSCHLISINGETSVNIIKADVLNTNAPMYNMAGQRVSKGFRGVVIQDGRKFINK